MPQKPPAPTSLPPKPLNPGDAHGGELFDTDTRRGRLEFVGAIAGFAALCTFIPVCAYFGYGEHAVVGLLMAIAAAVVWWVCAGEKGGGR